MVQKNLWLETVGHDGVDDGLGGLPDFFLGKFSRDFWVNFLGEFVLASKLPVDIFKVFYISRFIGSISPTRRMIRQNNTISSSL